MKLTTLLLALFASFGIPALAHAETNPSPSAVDARVRYLTYQSDEVYKLMVSPGRVMTVVFDPTETITALQAGDSASWEIVLLESGNVIVVKLRDQAGETNLTAISDTGRIYAFDLVPNASREGKPDNLAYLVRFNYPDAALQAERRREAALLAEEERRRLEDMQREMDAQRRADEEAERLRAERLIREEEERSLRRAEAARKDVRRQAELAHRREMDRIAAEEAAQLALLREQQGIEYDRRQQELRREEAARLAAEAERRRAEAARLAELELSARIAEQARQASEADRQRAEAMRLAAEARIRAQNRVASSMTLFDDGRPSVAASASRDRDDAVQRRRLSDNELFLASSFEEDFPTSTAQVLPRQDRLVAQGSIIQAILETAVNSDLPGMIRGQVSEDVYAFDGSAVMIPKGSRLIGRYSSNIEIGQDRIVAAWTRLIRPDGISIALGSPASDDLGVSGLSGDVDTHFAERFGSAALISVFAGISSYGSAQIDDVTGQDIASNVGSDFTGAAGTSFERYLSLAPTIRADQGSRVSVFVARDLFL